MPGIQLTQAGGAGVINAAGDQNPEPFASVISGVACALAPVGITSALWRWSVAGPTKFSATLSSASERAPIFTPKQNHAGLYTIELVDDAGNVYTLQLLVQNVVTTQRGQAITPAYVPPSQVEKPEFGESFFCDSTEGGLPSTKDKFGVIWRLRVGASQILDQHNWFVDEQNSTGLASDSNDGAMATTPLLTDAERQRRMGETPIWLAGATYHLRYLSDVDEIVISGRREAGAMIFVHGSATDGHGQATLYSGAIDNIVALARATNQPIEITSNDLATTWATPTNLIGSRIRLTSGAALGAKGWAIKQLTGKAARCCEFNAAAVFTSPFTAATGAATPSGTDTFVVERLTVAKKVFVNLTGGRGVLTNLVGVVFESLDVGQDVIAGEAIETVKFDGCIFRNSITTNGTFACLSFDACRLTVASGTAMNFPRTFRIEINGGYSDTATTNLNALAVVAIARHMGQGGRFVATGPAWGDIGAVGPKELGIFDCAAGDALTIKSPHGVVFVPGFILWGSGNVAYSVCLRDGAGFLWPPSGGGISIANVPITSTIGDVQMGGGSGSRASVPAFDPVTSTYTAPRLLSWANIFKTVADGGFCPTDANSPHFTDPVSGSHIGPTQ